MNYMVKRTGKKLRPILVFLSAKSQGSVTDATYVGASSVEIMHTATLVHEDVVDDEDQRRGFFSINALWKNKIAVLIVFYKYLDFEWKKFIPCSYSNRGGCKV